MALPSLRDRRLGLEADNGPRGCFPYRLRGCRPLDPALVVGVGSSLQPLASRASSLPKPPASSLLPHPVVLEPPASGLMPPASEASSLPPPLLSPCPSSPPATVFAPTSGASEPYDP